MTDQGENSGMERRSESRIRTSIPLTLFIGDATIKCIAKEFSSAGALLTVSQDLPPVVSDGMPVSFRFENDESGKKLYATIIHTNRTTPCEIVIDFSIKDRQNDES